MTEAVNDAIQERLEKESKELEAMCCCEPTVESRLEWAETDLMRCQELCRRYDSRAEALKELLADEVLSCRIANDNLRELRRENKKLNERAWKLKALLLDPENKIRMSKEIAEKIFKLLP